MTKQSASSILRRAALLGLAVALAACSSSAPAPSVQTQASEMAPEAPAKMETPAMRTDGPMPKAREVLDRFVEASGGVELMESVTSMRTKGTFSIVGQGMSGDLDIQAKAPDKFLLTIELAGLGQIRQGFDGEVGWSVDPMSGAQVLEEMALAQAKDQANFYQGLFRDEDYKSFELIELADFQGKPAYKVHVVSNNDIESMQYFSVDTGLLAGSESEQHSPMGKVPVTTVMSEYAEMDGRMVPVKIEQSMMGMNQLMTFTEMTFDEISDEVFALPAEIKAMLEPATP